MRVVSRRRFLNAGGWLVAGVCSLQSTNSQEIINIMMKGDAIGSNVWFDPIGLHLEPGQVVRWINTDSGNSHTATAYDPSNQNRPRRIPTQAQSWDSGYLLPGESFAVALAVEGVYDYFCIPHELAGMVGRIVVGHPSHQREPYPDGMSMALADLPSVAEILSSGRVAK